MAEANATRHCSIAGCDRAFSAKGWCSYHYKRARVTGDPTTPRRTRALASDAGCRAECSVPGCLTVVGRAGARGMCPTHYSRFRRNGDPGEADLRRSGLIGSCSVQGCKANDRAHGLCNQHYVRETKYGDAEYRHSFVCGGCGKVGSSRRPKKYCNVNCAALARRENGRRPTTKTCSRCSCVFDICVRDESGRIKRSDTQMCPDCKRGKATRHGWSVRAIRAVKPSTDCGICGTPIDLTLRKPDMMRVSIDHIIPYAHGGSNDIENLQLAHLHCNHVKSDSGWSRGRRVKRL